MKASLSILVTSIILFVWSPLLYSDARIELDSDTCHFPYDSADTDNENKDTCSGRFKETSADGAVSGFGQTITPNISQWYANQIETDYVLTGYACTLRNDDGTEAVVLWWRVESSMDCLESAPYTCTVTNTIYCWDPKSFQ